VQSPGLQEEKNESNLGRNISSMELVSKEECHILKAHKFILQNWAIETSILLDKVAASEATGRGS
jgi:hypothetical protein